LLRAAWSVGGLSAHRFYRDHLATDVAHIAETVCQMTVEAIGIARTKRVAVAIDGDFQMAAHVKPLRRTFSYSTLLSLGGGQVIVAEMHAQMVEIQRWMSNQEFANLLQSRGRHPDRAR